MLNCEIVKKSSLLFGRIIERWPKILDNYSFNHANQNRHACIVLAANMEINGPFQHRSLTIGEFIALRPAVSDRRQPSFV